MKYVIKKHFWGELPFDAIHYQSCYSNSQLKTFAFCLCSPCFHFFFVVDIKVSANARFLQSLCTLHNPIGTRGSSIATSCRKDRTGPSVRVCRDRVVHHVTGAMNYMSPLLVQNFISPSALVSVIMWLVQNFDYNGDFSMHQYTDTRAQRILDRSQGCFLIEWNGA